MNFLIGFSFIFILSIFTFVLYLIAKRLPKEFVFTPVVLMLVGDAVLAGLWYFGLVETVESVKNFRLGIAGAFATTAMTRSIYFMLVQDGESN